jgi:hypothetical protein
MKLTPLLLLVFAIACISSDAPKIETAIKKHPGDTCISMPLIQSEFGTDYRIKPVLPPAPFRLDTMIEHDTAKNYHRSQYFITSDIDPGLGMLCMMTMPSAYLLPNEQWDSSDQAWVTSFSKTGDLLCLGFQQQQYTEGAAHYLHHTSWLNYNCKTKKTVAFGDIFRLSSATDRQQFCTLINAVHNEPGYSENDIALDSSSVNDKTAFSIGCGQLTVYPGASDILNTDDTGYSIALEKVKTFLRPEYRWLVE